MNEARYVTRCEVQLRPLVNLMRNPTAQISLGLTSSANLTSLNRETGNANLSPHQTGFRLNGVGGSSDSFMVIEGDAGGGIRNGMQTGVQYTVSGSLYLPAALTGTANANARRIVVYHRIGAAAFTTVSSSQVPNATGQARVSVTFTLPAGTTEAFIRFYFGHPSLQSAFWHSLQLNEGTNTTYHDGDYPDDLYTWSSKEVGWDGARGLSTSRMVDRAQNIPLVDPVMEIDYDVRRVPFINARITIPMPEQSILDRLDPRFPRDTIINYSITHYGRTGSGALTTYKSSSPIGWGEDTAGKLLVRDVDIDFVRQTVTIGLTSAEVRCEDKKRIAVNTLDTGATNVAELFAYAITDVGEASKVGFLDAAVLESVPAGDRRLWMQGESASALFNAELAAVDLRHYGDDIGRHHARKFDDPPTAIGASVPLVDGDSGTLISATESRSRESGWRDATLVKAQYVNGSGTQITDYQRYPSGGENFKGEVVNLTRAIPSANYAEYATKFAQRRSGRNVTLVAHLDFTIRPGRTIALTFDGVGGATDVAIRPEKVAYRPDDGEMTIEGVRLA